MQRYNLSSRSILDTDSFCPLYRIRTECHQSTVVHDRSVFITGQDGHHIYASANIDETGEYDNAMKEWNVSVLNKNHAASCTLESLANLEIRIGNNYCSSFRENSNEMIARVYSIPQCPNEKSFSLTLSGDLIIIGRVHGWPQLDQRAPVDCHDDDDDDEGNEFYGSLELLFQCLKQECYKGAELSFGCVILKDRILGSDERHLAEIQDVIPNWETFE